MFNTLKAYKVLIKSKIIYWFLLIVFIILNLVTTIFVFDIKKDLQDALLTILSIIFPLIAGFLTFGRQMLKSLNVEIEEIVRKDKKDVNEPVTDSDKQKIVYFKKLATNFIKVIISTFTTSFILIVILLISKFNNFNFFTTSNFYEVKSFIHSNYIVLVFKLLFFYFTYIMFLNTLYLTIFITRITRVDSFKF